MRTILLIATGGTIASRPTAAGGLAPAITSQELLSCVPELAEFCRIDAIQLYNLDSTNMGPEQWQGIAAAVQENYDRYDGFVITHGTDTMGYTAAALSYMIQKSLKPVVLTGSQKSIYNRDTDARNNLWRAVAYACHPDAWGVQIVFDNQVILGTRARKTRTKSFNAFSSIDYPETAMFRDRRLIQFLQRPAEYTHAVFSTALDPNVFVLRLVPGMRADIIPMLEGRYRAWCWKALAWAACPAGMMVPCLPPCGTGAARGTWLCSPPRYRMRQRPCRVRSWPRGQSPARCAGSARYDPRSHRSQTDVGTGPDHRPCRGGKAVPDPRAVGYPVNRSLSHENKKTAQNRRR